jgi:DNA-binding MarR family transcriptional regulator
MTRQATNYLLGQLEEIGYLERRGTGDGARRLIYLTEKGWEVIRQMWRPLRAIEAEWATEVGPERFDTFMTVLRHLSRASR